MNYSIKKMWRTWIIVSMAFCMVILMQLGIHAACADSEPTIEYYGRYALSLEPNSKVLLYAYDQLVEGIGESKESISVYDGKNPITPEELEIAYDAYTRDHTEHFWLGKSYSYFYNSVTVLSMKPAYLLSGNELQTAKAEYEKAVETFLVGIDDSMTDFQKELLIHDRLANEVQYIGSTNAHNSYGALVEGKSVCEGYAEAFQYLLQRVGIQSFIAIGDGYNQSKGTYEAHAWNYVRIDEKYYQTDLTWNDAQTRVYHAYFNLSDWAMSEDHLLENTEYLLPSCTSEEAQYFTIMGGKMDAEIYSADFIASELKDGELKTAVYVTDSVSGFITWMKQNISDIAEKAGIRGGFSYRYSYLGREVFLSIEPNCKHTALTHVKATNPTCTVEGNKSYYQCQCGQLFWDANATQAIENRNSVVVAAVGHEYTEQIIDKAHLRSTASDCRSYDTYWYDCTRCSASAKNDSSAKKQYYNGTKRGAHMFTEKCADLAHLVAGSGENCQQAKKYYYDCAYCDQIGTSVWASDQYGEHKLSKQWSFDGTTHYHKCEVSGCNHVADQKACSGGTATCQKKAICSVCQNEYGSLKAHAYSVQWLSDSNQHWHACDCGAKADTASHGDHNKDGKCDQCKYVLWIVPDHTTAPEKTDPPATQPITPSTSAPVTQPITPSTSAPVTQPITPSTSVPATQPITPSTSAPVTQPITPSTGVPATQPIMPSTGVPATQPIMPSTSAPVTQPIIPSTSTTTLPPESSSVGTSSDLPSADPTNENADQGFLPVIVVLAIIGIGGAGVIGVLSFCKRR
jgi:hypothetical protein